MGYTSYFCPLCSRMFVSNRKALAKLSQYTIAESVKSVSTPAGRCTADGVAHQCGHLAYESRDCASMRKQSVLTNTPKPVANLQTDGELGSVGGHLG